MKALILNSGLGSRMGVLTSEHPKCMTEISPRETILSRQLRQLAEAGIRVRTLSSYYHEEPRKDSRCLVVNYSGLREEALEEALRILAEKLG